MEDFDKMYSEIELAIKTGVADICPSCKKATEIHSNPYYYHKCEHCGWTGSYRDCEFKLPKEFVKETLVKYGYEIK